ncbi:MAG: DUF1593 domain-containing protein [Bryobacterales bacterium]|jgi:hypothetical protein|nr:DUF1593 domain-containing protein [Bryobacterales bacterium]
MLRLAVLLAWCLSLSANTHRVLVSTDLGGDPDDIQSLYRLLHYSDILKIEGIVSSPGPGARNSAGKVRDWIRRIEIDSMRGNGYPELISEGMAVGLVRQGQFTPGAPSPARRTEGSEWIVRQANSPDPEGKGRPLWVLVWGSLTDVAQALHDDPSIAPKIRLYVIGSSNTRADPAARDFVYNGMADRWPSLWWIENGVMPLRSRDTFRGVYQGGEQTGEWGNQEFVRVHIRLHGLPGANFPLATSPAGTLKEGDSPSMLYLLSPLLANLGNPDDPTRESWGGQFTRPQPDRFPNYYTDLDAPAETCQATISRWRVDFLRDWKERWKRYP